MITHITKKNSAGSDSIPSMLRHTSRTTMRPMSPSIPLPLSPSCHDSNPVLTTMAVTMPTHIANWNNVTILPRRRGGVISEMYNGHTIEEMPTPKPPIQRKKIKEAVDHAIEHPTEHASRKTAA